MRPLRIEIEGFTAFREPTVIDFEDLDLFVLFGPTGSGKSSILDAMTWALYGEIARMGTQNLFEFITSGKTACTVSFTFKLRDEVFRVVRKMHRTTTPSSASFYLLDGENEIGLSDGIRDTNDLIEQKVGIDYDAFSRAVFLPQGKFAEFLQFGGKERRDLISDLFQLNYLEVMRRKAASTAKESKTTAERYEAQIEDDYSEVSAEGIESKKTSLKAALEKAETANERCASAEEAHRQYKEAFEKVQELSDARQSLEKNRARTEEFETKETELERARAAERVLPRLDRYEENLKEKAKAETDLGASEEKHSKAISQARKAEEKLETAREEAEQIEQWRKTIADLEKQEELIRTLDEARTKLTELAKRVEDTETKIEKNESEKDQSHQKAQDARKAAAVKRERLDELNFHREKLDRYDAKRDVLKDITRLRTEVAEKRSELEQKAEEAKETAVALGAANEAFESAEEAASRARARAEAARSALHELERSNQAQALRMHLHEGDACPVCEQAVQVVPDVYGGIEERLASARAKLEQAKSEREAAEAALNEAQRKRDRASSHLERAQDEEKSLDEAVKAKSRELEEAEESAREILAVHDGPEAALDEHQRLKEAAKSAQELRSEIQKLESDEKSAQLHVEVCQKRATELSEQQSTQRADRQSQKARVDQLEDEIGDDVPDDPKANVQALEDRIEKTEARIKEAEKELSEANAARAAASATVDVQRSALEDSKTKLEEATRVMRAALEEHGFDDAEAARAAVRETRVRQSLETEIQAWKDDGRQLEEKIGRLAGDVGDEDLTAERLKELDDEVEEKRKVRDDAQQALGGLRNEIEALAEKLEKKVGYESKLSAARAEYDLYHRLATLLRTDRFQEFVIEEYLDKIVHGASSQLMKLSGRYTLKYHEDSFIVVDHDNAQEERDAKTLSGGETFLASLSLALQLSEEIQKSAGNLQLDSLFIDEGFGTLDAETLDTVAEAIESLQQSGRLVGVITHIEEMMARLPQKIEVIKEVGGSRVEVGATQ